MGIIDFIRGNTSCVGGLSGTEIGCPAVVRIPNIGVVKGTEY